MPDFKLVTSDPQTQSLATSFNTTLWNDLQCRNLRHGFEKLLSRCRSRALRRKCILAIGATRRRTRTCWPSATSESRAARSACRAGSTTPRIRSRRRCWASSIARQATDENARLIAHRFADEIIFRLGGGMHGIAETKIYFVSSRSGSKEIWQMDYDGANQKQLTHTRLDPLSPHVSPDGSRVAFSGVTKEGWQIQMYSLELGRLVSFPALRRRQLFASLVVGRQDARFLLFPQRQHRDLHRGRHRRQLPALDRKQRPRHFALLESEDQRADRVGQRTHRPAADLHHGIGRNQRRCA